jgi:glycosyltransferase involved in cell wall biosynthesis
MIRFSQSIADKIQTSRKREPKLRIVVIGTRGFPNVQGGVEAHCEHLYPLLVEKGHEVIVFTRRPYITDPLEEYKGVKLIHLTCPHNKFLEAIVHSWKCVFQAKGLKPDIVHIHSIGPSLMAPLAKILGMKVVVTHHGPDYLREKWKGIPKHFLKFCEKMGMLFADRIITIAPYISTHIQSLYKKRAAVIPNGVTMPEEIRSKETLKKYNLEEKHYILTVGRFVPEKAFHDLIEAFRLYQSQAYSTRPWKLVIVGKADHRDEYSIKLRKLAEETPDVILTGQLKRKPLQELFQHCGMFVLPSRYEGLPIVLLEAMSCGAFCLASDIPANQCVPLDPQNYFSPGNVQELSQKLLENSTRYVLRHDRLHQMTSIRNTFDWQHIADKTVNVYLSLLRKSAA